MSEEKQRAMMAQVQQTEAEMNNPDSLPDDVRYCAVPARCPLCDWLSKYRKIDNYDVGWCNIDECEMGYFEVREGCGDE